MRTTFVALRHRNLRIWTAANFVSVTGTWMQVLAVNWFLLQHTGSTTQMGLAVLLHTAPGLLLSSWGGALADRLPARPLLVSTQLAHAVLAATLALVASASQPSVPAVYLMTAITGTVSALEGPAMGRFSSTVVPPALLGNSLALGSLSTSAARILGVSAGGVLVAMTGPSALFALNAASFVAVMVSLTRIRTDELHPLARGEAAGASEYGVRAGLRYLATQPVVLLTLGLAIVLGSLGRNYQVTMAAMSSGPLGSGAAGYGLLSSIFAAGTVLGALFAARQRELGYRMLIGTGLITGALQLGAGLSPGMLTFAAMLLPIAAGAVLIDTTVQARTQLDTREDMRGRVLGTLAMSSAIAGAAGAPLMGWLCEIAGARQSLVLAGAVVMIASTAAGVVIGRYRGLAVRPSELRRTLRASLIASAPGRGRTRPHPVVGRPEVARPGRGPELAVGVARPASAHPLRSLGPRRRGRASHVERLHHIAADLGGDAAEQPTR